MLKCVFALFNVKSCKDNYFFKKIDISFILVSERAWTGTLENFFRVYSPINDGETVTFYSFEMSNHKIIKFKHKKLHKRRD